MSPADKSICVCCFIHFWSGHGFSFEPHVTAAAEFAAVGDDAAADGAALADAAADAEAADESEGVAEALGAALAVADAEGASIPPVSSGTELFEHANEETETRNARAKPWEGRKVGEA
jgi:hypothetical protein